MPANRTDVRPIYFRSPLNRRSATDEVPRGDSAGAAIYWGLGWCGYFTIPASHGRPQTIGSALRECGRAGGRRQRRQWLRVGCNRRPFQSENRQRLSRRVDRCGDTCYLHLNKRITEAAWGWPSRCPQCCSPVTPVRCSTPKSGRQNVMLPATDRGRGL